MRHVEKANIPGRKCGAHRPSSRTATPSGESFPGRVAATKASLGGPTACPLAFKHKNIYKQEMELRQGWHYQANARAKAVETLTGQSRRGWRAPYKMHELPSATN